MSRTSCGTDSRSASGSFDRNTCAISTSSAPVNALAKSSWKIRRHEDGPDPRRRIRGAQAGQRFTDRGGMMREIIVNRDAPGCPNPLETTLDAGKELEALGRSLDAHPGFSGNRNGRKRVAHVERTDERHLECAERRPSPPHLEARRCTRHGEI